MNRKIYMVLLIFPIVGIIFSGCQKQAEVTIKIGCIFPLTGSGALWGQNGKKGVELAVEEINSSGGIIGRQIEMLYEDSKTEPKGAVSAFIKLVEVHNVKMSIVDMISSNVLAIAPIANEKKVVIISPGASSPKITDAGDYIFRNWPSDALQGNEAARFAFKSLGWRKGAIFFINNEYGMGLQRVFEEEFTKLGGSILLSEPFKQGDVDFRNSLIKLKNLDHDGIYLVGYPREVPIILKQSYELKLEKIFLGTETFQNPVITEQAGVAAEGMFYLIPQSPIGNKGRAAKFKSAFEKKFDEEPGVPADVAYDAVYILKWAVDQVGDNSEKIKSILYHLRDWEGASGVTTFDSNGDALKPFDIKIIKDGRFVIYVENNIN